MTDFQHITPNMGEESFIVYTVLCFGKFMLLICICMANKMDKWESMAVHPRVSFLKPLRIF
jgi:hypothetical protein